MIVDNNPNSFLEGCLGQLKAQQGNASQEALQMNVDLQETRERAWAAERKLAAMTEERDALRAAGITIEPGQGGVTVHNEPERVLEARLTRARSDALEEAAAICDRWLSAWGHIQIDSPARPYAAEVVTEISEAIRARAYAEEATRALTDVSAQPTDYANVRTENDELRRDVLTWSRRCKTAEASLARVWAALARDTDTGGGNAD